MDAPKPLYRRTDGPICGAAHGTASSEGRVIHVCALAAGHSGAHCCNSSDRDGCRFEWAG